MENISDITDIARYQVEPAIAVIFPPNRHLSDLDSKSFCKDQNFHVEHVTINLLIIENLLGCAVRKKLKTALRVGYIGKPNNCGQENAETLRSQLPVSRLSLQFGIQPWRAIQ